MHSTSLRMDSLSGIVFRVYQRVPSREKIYAPDFYEIYEADGEIKARVKSTVKLQK